MMSVTSETSCGLLDSEEEESKAQLMEQINELQDAVTEMKSAFTQAIQQLKVVQCEDHALREKVEINREQCEEQVSEVIKLILSLKSEVASLRLSLQTTQTNEQQLQAALQTVLIERDFLLKELVKAGALTEHVSQQVVRIHPQVVEVTDSPSSEGGSQSNDSGVALLLEKAHAAFSRESQSTSQENPNDNASSLPPDNNPATLASLVHDYVATLDRPNTPTNHAYGGPTDPVLDENHSTTYDSDSSLTLAATKSLSLSTSLSKQCGLELDDLDNNADRDNEDERQCTGTQSADCDVEQKRMNNRKEGQKPDSPIEDNQNTPRYQQFPFKEIQRLQVAKELLDTERKYCGTLWTINDTFAQPLRQTGILTNKDINTLFPEEVQQLYEQHCTLLHQLEERVANWSKKPTFGDVLARFTDPLGTNVLRLYTNYVNDFPEVLKTFHKLCRTSTEFTQFLKGCIDHPSCGGLDLGAFLLTPVQRMPRYILLLKQMLKFTDPSHQDYSAIHQCLERLRDYLGRLNDSMEHSFQLVAAQLGNNQQSNQHDESRRAKCNKRNSAVCKNISSPSFTKGSQHRGSLTVSESSDSTVPLEAISMTNCNNNQSKQYKSSTNSNANRFPVPAPRIRSTSVPRPVYSSQSQTNHFGSPKRSDQKTNYVGSPTSSSSSNSRPQLKSRSVSTTWVGNDGNQCTSCKEHCKPSHKTSHQHICSFIDSDSEDDSCEEDLSCNSNNIQCNKNTFPSSKSLHDIQQITQSNLVTMASEEIVCSEPSLGEKMSPHLSRPDSRQGIDGNNLQNTNLRPLSSAHSSYNVGKTLQHKEYFATIVARNSWIEDSGDWSSGSSPSTSKQDGKSKKEKSSSNKKKISFKASLKNILTPFKKRGSSRTLHGTDQSIDNLPINKHKSSPSPFPSMFYCDLDNSLSCKTGRSLCDCKEGNRDQ